MDKKEIDDDRKVVRNFASWLGRAGKKYITGLPCGYSIQGICESIRNVVRHDTIASKSIDRMRRVVA